MPFVHRNAEGVIVALYDTAREGATEELPADHAEIVAFLNRIEQVEQARALLSTTDVDMARVVEDLLTVLVEKKVVLLTDLPPAAQKKYFARRTAREQLASLDNLMVDENGVL